MENDAVKQQKLDIATRAGKLSEEIGSLMNMILLLQSKKAGKSNMREGREGPDMFSIQIHRGDNSSHIIRTHEWDPKGTALHDSLLACLQLWLDERERELDELIKVLV